MTDPEVPITTHDCGAFVIDIPSAWQGVRGSEGVHAWAEPELVEHVIVGGYHLAETVDAAERATLIDFPKRWLTVRSIPQMCVHAP